MEAEQNINLTYKEAMLILGMIEKEIDVCSEVALFDKQQDKEDYIKKLEDIYFKVDTITGE